jgi:hypothetical protein
MIGKEEILKRLSQELPYLKEKYHVKRIGIFGSYARGQQRPESDLDLLVEFSKPVGFFKFIELEDYLTEKLGIKVELVTGDAVKPLIRNQVLQEAIYV